MTSTLSLNDALPFYDFAKKVCSLLNNYDIRASIDDRNETIGKKIRENELKRMPYQLIVGEKEVSLDSVSVRKQGGEDLGVMKVEDFASLIKKEINAQIDKKKL